MNTNEALSKQLSSMSRIDVIRHACRMAKPLPGLAAEFGVWQGESAKIIATELPNKPVYCFDTFTGIPDLAIEGVDGHHAGDFANTSVESVTQYLSDCRNTTLVPGIFPASVNAYGLESVLDQFAFVHIDVDIYNSALAGIEFFYPRMVRGGIMLFCDYDWIATKGVEKVIHEYFDPLVETGDVSLTPIKRGPALSGQCLVIRLNQSV